MHDDVSCDTKSNVFSLDKIACILMQRQWYLKSLDLDGKRKVTNIDKEVYKRSSQYYDLVVTRKDEDKYDFENTLEVHKLFNWIKHQSRQVSARMYMP